MLYTPVTFRSVELKNRWVMSPMCMYSSEDGLPNDITEAVHRAGQDFLS